MHGSPRRYTLRRVASRFAFAAAILALVPGCSRKFFRQRADKEVENVITQKNMYPDWEVRNWNVYPDPRSRFADTSNPDHPPYPPDDPAVRRLSPNPQWPTRKSGAGRVDGDGYMQLLTQWDAENRASDPPPPKKDAAKEPEREKLPPPKPLTVGALGISPAVWLASKDQPGPRVVGFQETPKALGRPSQGLPPPKDLVPAITAKPSTAELPDPDAGGDFLKALTSNECRYKVTMQQAIELGILNSREFQDRREDLYLAALPVTLERFSFAAQGFFTEQIIRERTGRLRTEGEGDRWRLNSTTGITKRFATGAALAVSLANQFVIDFSGDRPRTSLSNLTLSLAQPFLRGGGFAVTLEPLTQQERNMVYAMRSYARFRKLYYVSVAAGGNITNNPYGLQGLSVNLGRGIGGNLTAPVVGYLPLLRASAVIANQRKNITALEELLRLYQAFREGGQQSDLQVSQVEQNLLNSRNSLLGSGGGGGGGGSGLRGFADATDNFKLQLGLPLTVGLDFKDTPLMPIRQQLGRFEEVYAQVLEVEQAARRFDPAAPAAQLRTRLQRLLTESTLVRGTKFSDEIRRRWAGWQQLTDDQMNRRLLDLADQRRKALDAKADRQARGIPESEAEAGRLIQLNAEIDLGQFEKAVRGYETQPWLKETSESLRADVQAGAFRDAFNAFYQLILEGRNERLAETRTKWPKLPKLPVAGSDILETSLDEAYTAAIQAALTQRLDLMNARGQVVDAWRQIKVQANSLQGVFDLRYDLNAATPAGGNTLLGFAGSANRHQMTARLELPLVRRAERNNYRAALIGYQRQKRTLQAFEDNIANDVRGDVRELRALAEAYKFQQRLVELGYSQVDNAQSILLAPPAPGAGNDAGSAAALTQQVLQAQNSLLQAQNDLYTIWVSYLTARMNLFLDLESLQIDERGVWCDEFDPESLSGSQAPPGPPQPERQPAGERLPAPREFPGGGRQ